MTGPVVTIDGPAGSGKSTVARALATRTGIPFLSTGYLYRGVAVLLMKAGLGQGDPTDDDLAAELARHDLSAVPTSDGAAFAVVLDGLPLSEATLRGPGVGEAASRFAARPVVRDYLLATQRRAAQARGAVVEGRDTGSVVFPEADVKVYLSADPTERARRRALELGRDPDDPGVLAAMRRRDERDAGRETAPLTVPEGAVELDSTGLSVDRVVDRLVDLIDSAFDAPSRA